MYITVLLSDKHIPVTHCVTPLPLRRPLCMLGGVFIQVGQELSAHYQKPERDIKYLYVALFYRIFPCLSLPLEKKSLPSLL